MKLKYYMRGLGIGIILTTLILVISGNKEKLTNEEIISRAMKLGMVMEEQQTKAPEPTNTPEPTQTLKTTIAPEPSETPKPTKATQKQENNQKDITFTIVRGMSSGKVSVLLYQNGLVDDAENFNEFIVQVGKADVIGVGTFTVSMGASYEEILGMITSN